MNIALIGYGKMGKEIEQVALERNHQISCKITVDNPEDLLQISLQNTQVAIEFTQPEAAFENVKKSLEQKVPVVCGTTGWLEKLPEIEKICQDQQTAFLYASNFSLGVNLFFALNRKLAELMKEHAQYRPHIEEIHHTEKKDAPSGTAITLAQGILENYQGLEKWVNHLSENKSQLEIISKRELHVPGTHTVTYSAEEDFIEIKHQAHTRRGFAIGAVLAAEFLVGKQGVFTMNDVLKL